MALFTVQRSPSPSESPDTEPFAPNLGGSNLQNEEDEEEEEEEDEEDSWSSPEKSKLVQAKKRFRKCLAGIRFLSRLRLSETYLSFKGAALILPQSECLRTVGKGGSQADIHAHLQSMFYLLRPQDTIKMAIKLESLSNNWIRYMAVVTTFGIDNTEESLIMGVDICEEATIGLVLPVWGDMTIKMDGDGGFNITSNQSHHIFKPVSVQAMWSAWQCLNKICDLAAEHKHYPSGLSHTWVQFYTIVSPPHCMKEWNTMEDLECQRPDNIFDLRDENVLKLEALIHNKLREVMMTVDLEEVTSKFVRERMEEELSMSLREHKQFIDQEMIFILRQMDAPSKIMDFLYLGSEWNASNLEELKINGIGHILNVTREIDNFFPGLFTYQNIRVFDVDDSDLMKYWEETYKFICKARKSSSIVLVHCKMGVSRSASTVIAFAMKDNCWSLEEALGYVQSKRSCVRPNDGFMKQLKIYEGILAASNQRHNQLWKSNSTGNLHSTPLPLEETVGLTDCSESDSTTLTHHDSLPSLYRPKSWSTDDCPEEVLLISDNFVSHDGEDEDRHSGNTSLGSVENVAEAMQYYLESDSDSWYSDAEEDQESLGCSAPLVLKSNTPVDDCQSAIVSESTDDHIDIESRTISGYYDVSMIASAQNKAFSSEFSIEMETSSLLHLHPDVMLEQELTTRRQENKLKSLLDEANSPNSANMDDLYMHQAERPSTGVQEIPVKVKADDSWIKSTPPLKDIFIVDCDSKVIEETVVSPDSEALVLNSEPSHPNNTTGKPYEHEAIPWSPGTVRRHAQDLECRMTTTMVPLPLDTFGTSPPCKQATVPLTISAPTSSAEIQEFEHCSPDGSYSNLFSSFDHTCAKSQETRPRSHSHVLDCEDVQVTQGHVLKTKMEIEQRERSSSFYEMSPDQETSKVQRSSSYKGHRKSNSSRFDRSSERRKTCLPVLHPTHSPPKMQSLSLSLEEVSGTPRQTDNNTEQITDELLMKSGKIQNTCFGKFKKRMEKDRSIAKDTILADKDEVLISHGSVERTKQQMMERYGGQTTPHLSPPAAFERPNSSSEECHKKLKHSKSSPQLYSVGHLAYPGEQDITWSVGTVKHHKTAIENKSKEQSYDISPVNLLPRLSSETLGLIRQIGTAWSLSPRAKQNDSGECCSSSGPAMVKRLTYQIEGYTASQHIQKKIHDNQKRGKLVKKTGSTEDSSDDGCLSDYFMLPRSASMKETSSRVQSRSRILSEKTSFRNADDLCSDTVQSCADTKIKSPGQTKDACESDVQTIPARTVNIKQARDYFKKTKKTCSEDSNQMSPSSSVLKSVWPIKVSKSTEQKTYSSPSKSQEESSSGVSKLHSRYRYECKDEVFIPSPKRQSASILSLVNPSTTTSPSDQVKLSTMHIELETAARELHGPLLSKCRLDGKTPVTGQCGSTDVSTISSSMCNYTDAVKYHRSHSAVDGSGFMLDSNFKKSSDKSENAPVVQKSEQADNPNKCGTPAISGFTDETLLDPVVQAKFFKVLFPETKCAQTSAGPNITKQSPGTLKNCGYTMTVLPSESSPQKSDHLRSTLKVNSSDVCKQLKLRKLHGKSHPLSKLVHEETSTSKPLSIQGRTNNPLYNTL